MDIYSIIKCAGIGVSLYLFFLKLINFTFSKNKKIVYGSIFVFQFTLVNTVLSLLLPEPFISILTLFVLDFLVFKTIKDSMGNTFVLLVTAYSFAYTIYMLCSLISSAITAFHFEIEYSVFITLILQLSLSILLYRVLMRFSVRGRKGLGKISIVIAGVILSIYSIVRMNEMSFGFICLFMISLCLLVLSIYFILKRESIASLNEIVQKQKENQINLELKDLMQTHDYLASRVHKDNKSLTALHKAVLVLANESTDINVKNKALDLLEDLTDFRQSLEEEKQKYYDTTYYTKSGLIILDSILLEMLDKAERKGITLNIEFQDELDSLLTVISQEKLSSLLADLIENAIIAVEYNENLIKEIDLIIYKESNVYVIVVKDTGVNFDKNVLDSIGKRKYTTYSDSGGTGNGLWNVFKTMKLTKMSFIVRENFLSGNEFTKEVYIKFDGKCEFRHETRKKELKRA